MMGALALLVIAVVGLLCAKWLPYTGRVHTLAGAHTWSGGPILTTAGPAGSTPSLTGALAFAGACIAAVWPAAVVGITVAAALESLVRRHWLVRMLSHRSRWG